MRNNIADYVLGLLSQVEIEALYKHINQCHRCKQYTNSLQREKRSLLQFGETLDSQMDARQAKMIQTLNKTSSERTRPLSILRIILKSKITKYAAVAMIIIAFLIGVKIFTGSVKDNGRTIVREQDINQKQITFETSKDTKPGPRKIVEVKLIAQRLEAELKDVDQMFAAGDITGLLDMLDKGQWETKVAAANYLARIGDLSAVEALENLNTQWNSGSENNPFDKAIQEIRNRMIGESRIENTTTNVVVNLETDVNTPTPNDIYIVSKTTWSDGEIKEYYEWLKDEILLRQEHPGQVTIDDGVHRLVLDKVKNTAQLSDSHAAVETYMENGQFEIVSAFMGYESTAFKIAELPGESNSSQTVYEVTYRDYFKAKAWVDPQSNLPVRLFTDTIKDDRQRHVVAIEIVFNYNPIPLEKFDITIPPGFEQLERVKTPTISGLVVDEYGNGIANAQVYVTPSPGYDTLPAETNKSGEFIFELPPRSMLNEFPMIIWAFPKDDPSRMAWMIVRDPNKGQIERRRYVDRIFEGSICVDLEIGDVNELNEYMPGKAGQFIFESAGDLPRPHGIRNIVLELVPASTITGNVRDDRGRPITDAEISLDWVRVKLNKNDITVHNSQEAMPFAVTDANGYYQLAPLPRFWDKVILQANENSYVISENQYERKLPDVEQELDRVDGYDFVLRDRGVIIRGIVIDNYGEPLADREVDIVIEEDGRRDDKDFDFEGAVIDANGRFELVDVPMVEGLSLIVRSDYETHHWRDNDKNKDKEYIYYSDTVIPFGFDPNKKEYWIEITPQRPDITIEVEVVNSAREPLVNIPLGFYGSNINSLGSNSDINGEWSTSRLLGTTDEFGLYKATGLPAIEQLNLWICKPEVFGGWEYWGRKFSEEYRQAIAESQEYYSPMRVPIELEQNRKKYRIKVTLLTIEEYRNK